VKKRDQGPTAAANGRRAGLCFLIAWALCASPSSVVSQQPTAQELPIYRQPQAPVEARIDDLLGRMTLVEKVHQLDLYSGAKDLVDIAAGGELVLEMGSHPNVTWGSRPEDEPPSMTPIRPRTATLTT
jgi:hypothetical protein